MSVAKEETVARLKEQIESKDEEQEEVLPLEAEVEVEPEEEETPEQRSSTREYVVLVKSQDKEKAWVEIGRETAASTEAALKALGEALEDGRSYVAVPARSWNPVPVSIKTTTTINFQ